MTIVMLKKSISDEIAKLESIKQSILELGDRYSKIYLHKKSIGKKKVLRIFFEDITASPKIEKNIQEISETPPKKRERFTGIKKV